MRIDSHHSCSERYPLAHLETILKRNRFEGSVLVAEPPPEIPEFVRGIVVPVAGPIFPAELDRLQRLPKFRGVQLNMAGGIPDGLDEIWRRGLRVDVTDGLHLVPEIMRRHPGLRLAIDHLGNPPHEHWDEQLEAAAQFPRAFCKLSAVTRLAPAARPFVQHALAIFGPDRLMFGSDWPAGLPEYTWKASLAAFTQALGAQSIEVREQLLGGTAERFYAL